MLREARDRKGEWESVIRCHGQVVSRKIARAETYKQWFVHLCMI